MVNMPVSTSVLRYAQFRLVCPSGLPITSSTHLACLLHHPPSQQLQSQWSLSTGVPPPESNDETQIPMHVMDAGSKETAVWRQAAHRALRSTPATVEGAARGCWRCSYTIESTLAFEQLWMSIAAFGKLAKTTLGDSISTGVPRLESHSVSVAVFGWKSVLFHRAITVHLEGAHASSAVQLGASLHLTYQKR